MEPSQGLAATARRPTTRAAILTIPLVVPVGIRMLPMMLARRLGARHGYLAGFGVYGAGCYLVLLALVGRRRIAALFCGLRTACLGHAGSARWR